MSLLRSTSILSFLTLISRVLGLLREMTKAALLGTGVLSDGFSVAFMLPNLFRRLFAEGSAAVAFIPVFKEYLINDDYKETREFLSCITTVLTFLVSLVTAAGIFFAPAIVGTFGIKEAVETALLTRIMFPFLIFISIAALFQGVLNSVRVFTPSAFAPIVLNITTIAFAWGLKDFCGNSARAMSFGVLAGGFLSAALQAPFVLKKGFKFKFVPLKRAFANAGTRKTGRLVIPTIIGMAAYQLNDLVSTALAGRAGTGVVSSLSYSLRLQELILGVFAVSIGTVLLPELTECAKLKEWEKFNKNLSSAISVIALITLPVIAFSLCEGEFLIRLLFQSREFDEVSVALTLDAFIFHISGLFFIALNRILSPAFYAQSDTVHPTVAGIISFILNMVLAFILAPVMKGGGIALALSLAGFVNTIFLFIFFRGNKNINLKKIVSGSFLYFVKVALFAAAAAAVLLVCKPFAGGILALFISNESNKILRYALPLCVHFVIFIAVMLTLLAAFRDKYILSLVKR